FRRMPETRVECGFEGTIRVRRAPRRSALAFSLERGELRFERHPLPDPGVDLRPELILFLFETLELAGLGLHVEIRIGEALPNPRAARFGLLDLLEHGVSQGGKLLLSVVAPLLLFPRKRLLSGSVARPFRVRLLGFLL